MSRQLFKIKKNFASEKKSISEVEPMLDEIKNKIHIPDEFFYNVLVAVTEAVNNAIIHGNRLNPGKKVKCIAEAYNSSLTFTVIDEGDGFAPEKIADPRTPENLLKDNGRGIFLIRSLSTDVSIKSSSKGTKISMVFNF